MTLDHPISLPGLTIGSLATASGTDFIDAALGVATVLGGIAGPHNEIDTPVGEADHEQEQ